MTPTYRVSTWDMDLQEWHEEQSGLSLWQLRPVLRGLRRLGWTACSLLVEREDADHAR